MKMEVTKAEAAKIKAERMAKGKTPRKATKAQMDWRYKFGQMSKAGKIKGGRPKKGNS
jgi:hypothetical protein